MYKAILSDTHGYINIMLEVCYSVSELVGESVLEYLKITLQNIYFCKLIFSGK